MNLGDWLQRIEKLHPKEMDLGLERIASVLRRLDLDNPAVPVISVAGTNGKGSSVAFLESVLSHAGHRTGAYTSPHLNRFNERIRIGGADASDDEIVVALEAVEQVRGDLRLTYFEFSTAAALWLMREACVDAVLLEVGLGGRLDAVNAVDADVAVVTSIGLDHEQWLGSDREAIGAEKAGIFRAGRPAVCGDPDPPASIARVAERIGARLLEVGRDFHHEADGRGWRWRGQTWRFDGLPAPALPGAFQRQNAAAALAALEQVRERLPVTGGDVHAGIASARLPGRVQIVPGDVTWVLDVAHNAPAARALAHVLAELPVAGRTIAVVGMLDDKRVEDVGAALAGRIDACFTATLPPPRGLDAYTLARRLSAPLNVAARPVGNVAEACREAVREARNGDRILVFGSFFTVGPALVDILATR